MEFQNVLNARKSIRKYDGSKKVPKEQLEEMVRAAILAPSWKNSQTGRYYVAYSDEAIAKVKKCLPDFNVKSTEGASAYIITAFVKGRSGCERDGSPSTELAHNEWGVYDLALKDENLILKAAELGLGSLIVGIRDADALKREFEIPDDQIVLSVIAVGYAAIDNERPKRKSVEEIAKFF